jgi:hypothetical protein
MNKYTDFQGRWYYNATPHPVTLQGKNEEIISIPPHGVINARAVERQSTTVHPAGVALVETDFIGTPEGDAILESIPAGVVIIGSIIAAQAYPGRVLGMVPVPGFERVPPAEKRMQAAKFTVFADPTVIIV